MHKTDGETQNSDTVIDWSTHIHICQHHQRHCSHHNLASVANNKVHRIPIASDIMLFYLQIPSKTIAKCKCVLYVYANVRCNVLKVQ